MAEVSDAISGDERLVVAVLELVITPIGWQFGFDLMPAFALVLWGLGWSTILLALAIRLPLAIIAALSLALIGGHNLLDPIRPDALGAFAGFWHFLHAPGFFIPGKLYRNQDDRPSRLPPKEKM